MGRKRSSGPNSSKDPFLKGKGRRFLVLPLFVIMIIGCKIISIVIKYRTKIYKFSL